MEFLEAEIKRLGFLEPTLIQEKSYQAFLANKSAILLSPTGTGKTLAYLIPLLKKITNKSNHLQALIIVPTTELALQIKTVLRELKPAYTHQTISASDDRLRAFKSFTTTPPQLLVITPGRLADLEKEGLLNISTVKELIIDEADMMFSLDFLKEIDNIIKKTKANIYLFSATLPAHLLSWAKSYFKGAFLIDVRKEIKLNINHHLIFTSGDKEERLFKLLKVLNPFLSFIFVSRNADIEPLYLKMLEKGYQVGRLSSKQTLRERKTIINNVNELKYQYLISSDLGSRGLDFEAISDIIHYDFPYCLEYYYHRSGRTGRMLQEGNVYLFFEDRLNRKIAALKKGGIEFKEYQIKNEQLIVKPSGERTLTAAEIKAIRSVKKPTKVKPGYKKKYQKEVQKALKKARYQRRIKK